MSEVQIWHNPRCSKSRAAMTLLEENGIEADVVKYLEADIDEAMIKELLLKLDIDAIDLMRTKEDIFNKFIAFAKPHTSYFQRNLRALFVFFRVGSHSPRHLSFLATFRRRH